MSFINSEYIKCYKGYVFVEPSRTFIESIQKKAIYHLAKNVLDKSDEIKSYLPKISKEHEIQFSPKAGYAFYAEISDLNDFSCLPIISIIKNATSFEQILMNQLISTVTVFNQTKDHEKLDEEEIVSLCLFFGSREIQKIANNSFKTSTSSLDDFEESLNEGLRDTFVRNALKQILVQITSTPTSNSRNNNPSYEGPRQQKRKRI